MLVKHNLSNTFYVTDIYFPFTQVRLKITEERYLKIDFQSEIVAIPQLHGLKSYSLIGNIESIERLEESYIHIDVKLKKIARVLTSDESHLYTFKIKNELLDFESSVGRLVDHIQSLSNQLQRLRNTSSTV